MDVEQNVVASSGKLLAVWLLPASFRSLPLPCPSPPLATARIAQRFALVKIHYLSNSGRAKPKIGVVISAAEAENDDYSSNREPQTRTAGEKKAVEDAIGGGSASPEAASTPRVLSGGETSVEQQQQQQPRPSLDCTVAAIAGLPQEVLRRIVGYCTL